ncbi:MAG: histidine--tRNA ligase [Christensenellaceae bacterium]|jgi:histidyl-tRNA synthetase|nr:histidine--tRNA ligase [Christensenellaceae bacterium]
MESVNTKVLPGFMELLPEMQIEFERIKTVIEDSYKSFGFSPIDTPVIERSESLLAKAGGETEKQIYRFNKGDNDLSLRFDLTVPLARYVADHFNDLSFPFRRYHIGKVYRGESPQKGRFREFYQADIDVIGRDSLSLLYDGEIPVVIYTIFSKLNFGAFKIRINNRKLLNGLLSSLNLEDKGAELLRIIDKKEKVSETEFALMLANEGINAAQAKAVSEFIAITGNCEAVLLQLKKKAEFIKNDLFSLGVTELETVVTFIKAQGIGEESFAIDLSIARGLDYYTGTVYETSLTEYPKIGSVCSGGRYDNLASYYTKEKLPGVGISIGLTRLFWQLTEAGIIKPSKTTQAEAVVVPLSEGNVKFALKIANELRCAGIATDILLESGNVKKKFKYVSNKNAPYTVVIGDDEEKENAVNLQIMQGGVVTKEKISADLLVTKLK